MGKGDKKGKKNEKGRKEKGIEKERKEERKEEGIKKIGGMIRRTILTKIKINKEIKEGRKKE